MQQVDRDTILADFAVYCFLFGFNKQGIGNTIGTIRTKVSAVKWLHAVAAGYTLNTGPVYSLVNRGLARKSGAKRSKAPVSIAFILMAATQLKPLAPSAAPVQQLAWGLMTLAFFFLLRRSEFAIEEDGKVSHAIKAKDITVVDRANCSTRAFEQAYKVTLFIRSAKNDTNAQGCKRVLFKSGHDVVCPVRAALCVLQARNYQKMDDFACILPNNRGRVTFKGVSQVVKLVAEDLGLNPKLYSSHSIRAGGATYMFRQGIEPLIIKTHGRWNSNTFARYLHLCEKSLLEVAKDVVNGPKNLDLVSRNGNLG